MRFWVDDTVWELFPDARIGVVVVRGVDNTRGGIQAAVELERAANKAREDVDDVELALYPPVLAWREAYRAFGAKPSKYHSSIESLLRSARAGSPRSVNPLVDLYNAVSLRQKLPCGGEDLAAVAGDIRLVRAAGDERFVPLGSREEQPPRPGELIYRDDLGVLCRCWNWREADRTKLTPGTTSAFLCIESVLPDRPVEPACQELAALVTRLLGGTADVYVVHREAPDCTL